MDIHKRQIFEFVKTLNFGLKNKKKYVVGLRFKNCDLLLIYLFEMRLIKNYKIIDTNQFTIELAYDIHGNSIIKGIKNISLKRYKEQINLKSIYRLIREKTPLYLFLETRYGVLPLTTCFKYKTGGNLLFWIY